MARKPGQPGDAVRKQHPDFLVKEVADLKRDMRELRQALAQQTGMSFVNKQITVAADTAVLSQDFDGTLSPPTAGSNGWALTGDTVIANAAVFKNAIIGDNALTNPVRIDAGTDSADTFALTTTATTRATVTMPVPAGFTQALVFGVANVTGFNSTASYDSVDVGIWIQGASTGGLLAIQGTTPGGTVGASRGGSSLLTGLAGGNVTVQSRVRTGSAGWASSAANSTNLDAIAVFLR